MISLLLCPDTKQVTGASTQHQGCGTCLSYSQNGVCRTCLSYCKIACDIPCTKLWWAESKTKMTLMHKTSCGRNWENYDYVRSLRGQHLSVIWVCTRTNVKQRVCSRFQPVLPDYCSVNLQSQVMCLTAPWAVSSLSVPSPSHSVPVFLSNSSSFFGCWGASLLSYKKHGRWKTEHVLWIFICFLTEVELRVANVSHRKWH